MAISNIEAVILGSVLQFKWKLLLPETRLISIQLAFDSNFTKNMNHFVIPTSASSVNLDVGQGAWFFRFGTWIGKDLAGDVTWSPTYGPANVICTKPFILPPPPNITIHHSFPIGEGIRFISNTVVKSIICVEICKDSNGFEANNTVMKYYVDWGDGGFDLRGLDPLNSFALRVTKFPSNYSEFPKTNLFHMPAGALIGSKRPLRAQRHKDTLAMTETRGDSAVLRDIADQRRIKFSSQADYLRFLAAKTKSQYR